MKFSTRALLVAGGLLGAMLGTKAATAADEAEPAPWCWVDDDNCYSTCNGKPDGPESYLKDHKNGEPPPD